MIRLATMLAAAAALWLAAAPPTIVEFGFDLSQVADSGTYFVYDYTLWNGASSTWGIGSVAMDNSASSGTPTNLAATGDVLDGPGYPTATAPLSPYAQVGPISPTPWKAYIGRDAILEWAPPAPGYQSADSVAPGDTLLGFGIRSSYLPGLRVVTAAPTYQSCCSTPADPQDPTGRLDLPDAFPLSRMTIGPRYKPDEIDIDLLQNQLDAVCDDPLWIDNASLCTEMADSLEAVASGLATANLEGAREALYGVAGLIERNVDPLGDIEVPAAYLLQMNIVQLQENIGR